MGNLNENSFDEIWNSEKARKVRDKVANCKNNCWMIGSVAPVMKQRLYVPTSWVIKHKIKGKYSLNENTFIKSELL